MSDSFSLSAATHAIEGALGRIVHGIATHSGGSTQDWPSALAQYGTARAQTLEIVRDLTQVQSDFHPAPKTWSIGQNVEHLLLTEKHYRTQMKNLIRLAKLGGRTNINLTFEDMDTSIAHIPREVMPLLSLPLQMFNMFVPQTVRETLFRLPLIPAGNPSVSEPVRTQPIADLRARAVSSLAETEEVFRGDLPPNLGAMTLSHPVLGTNTIVQIFAIISAHEERHHGQMRRVLGNDRFPRST